jgi:hypothetical protein
LGLNKKFEIQSLLNIQAKILCICTMVPINLKRELLTGNRDYKRVLGRVNGHLPERENTALTSSKSPPKTYHLAEVGVP